MKYMKCRTYNHTEGSKQAKKGKGLCSPSLRAGILALSLALAQTSFITAFAGPADESFVSAGGSASSQDEPSGPAALGPAAPANTADYYMAALSDPIVKPVDKYSYEQMEQDINALKSRYPGQMTVNVIGQSADGRNLYDIIVGNPSASKHILFQGTIHAREYINVPLMMQQLEYLLAFQNTGSYNGKSLSDMLNQAAIHFVPLVNPDGAAISQNGENGIRSEELKAQIRTAYETDKAEGRTSADYDSYLKRWKSNGRGVDLNHNFDAGWSGLNTVSHPSSSDYKGTAPLSEPEAMALASLTDQYPFAACISYHAMGQVIYWDTEHNGQTADSRELAELVSKNNGYQILASKGVAGYKDWIQQRSASIPGITIEVGKSACPVSFSEYNTIWEQNRAVPGMVIDYVISH